MSQNPLPLLAALTYSVIPNQGEDVTEASAYDPTSQRTVYAMGGRDYSTCREDDSAGTIFNSKNDTKKDD